MEKVREYLLNNFEVLKDTVRELNGWNGCLDYLDAEYNDDEFFNVFFEGQPMEAVRAAHFGSYNYSDEYVKFNGYGNLETMTKYEYKRELESSIDDIVDELIENQSHIHVEDELQELIEEMDQE